jgi:hypothetical protein
VGFQQYHGQVKDWVVLDMDMDTSTFALLLQCWVAFCLFLVLVFWGVGILTGKKKEKRRQEGGCLFFCLLCTEKQKHWLYHCLFCFVMKQSDLLW